jgi:hypothetical protein
VYQWGVNNLIYSSSGSKNCLVNLERYSESLIDLLFVYNRGRSAIFSPLGEQYDGHFASKRNYFAASQKLLFRDLIEAAAGR